MNIIENEKHWRISKSGCSIKTGWHDSKEIICQYHGELNDGEAFNKWLDNAELICELHNKHIDRDRVSHHGAKPIDGII